MTQENNDQQLKMTFTPNTIEHLGVRMYSTLPPVIAELVANSQDADAHRVTIQLKDQGEKEIIVSDDGTGMSFSDINQKFLRIGRNRRDEESQLSPGGRKVIGKKGLGKLSFFGIAHVIEVQTTKDHKRNSFVMKWDSILSEGNDKYNQDDYHPDITEYDVDSEEENGTIIILRDIQRLCDFDANSLADNLSRFFIIDQDFNIFIKHNDEPEILIDNERKYSSLEKQIEWNIPEDIELSSDYEKQSEIKGHLLSTEKPIPPSTNMKGITLFSRKKLVNAPEYFSDSTSSHFFTYLTGWLEVDFIDELGEDVIGTNRQSLNWEHPDMVKLREYLQKMLRWLESDWRTKRAALREKKLEDSTGIKIGEWREHIPKEINDNLESIIGALTKDAELPDDKAASSLKGLQNIIKPYPFFHWQNLHPTLHTLAFPYYKSGDYYAAVFEGVKMYVKVLKAKTGQSITDRNLIENIFALVNPKLSVTKKFKKPDGTDFEIDTTKKITEGHRMLILAMWDAFRDPIAHEVVIDLRDSGLYTEQDCLDALALLSHLFRRMDNADTP